MRGQIYFIHYTRDCAVLTKCFEQDKFQYRPIWPAACYNEVSEKGLQIFIYLAPPRTFLR